MTEKLIHIHLAFSEVSAQEKSSPWFENSSHLTENRSEFHPGDMLDRVVSDYCCEGSVAEGKLPHVSLAKRESVLRPVGREHAERKVQPHHSRSTLRQIRADRASAAAKIQQYAVIGGPLSLIEHMAIQWQSGEVVPEGDGVVTRGSVIRRPNAFP